MATDHRMFSALLQRQFSFFLRYGFREIGGDGDYAHGWYIDAVIHALEQVRLGKVRRLIITLPPRHLKSVIVSTCWPAWLLRSEIQSLRKIIADELRPGLAEKLHGTALAIMDAPFYRQASRGVSSNPKVAVRILRPSRRRRPGLNISQWTADRSRRRPDHHR